MLNSVIVLHLPLRTDFKKKKFICYAAVQSLTWFLSSIKERAYLTTDAKKSLRVLSQASGTSEQVSDSCDVPGVQTLGVKAARGGHILPHPQDTHSLHRQF